MNNEWKEYKLGEIITMNYGKALKEQDRVQGDIPVYSSAGIIGYHNQAIINSKGIIVGRKGTVGKIYFSDVPFCCIDTAYYLLPNDKNYDIEFLFYLLQTIGLQDLNEDSAVPGLNRNTFYSIEVLFPPLPEQNVIASILSSLDDKIDLLYRQNKTLEQLAETIFRQWFVEEANESWKLDELKNYVKVVDNRGKTPPNEEIWTDFPLIEANALNDEERLVNYSVIKKYVTEDIFNNWFRNKLNKYDTLITTVGANIGAMSMYLLEKGNIAQNIIGLSAVGISPFYLYQVLKFKKSEIIQMDIGGVQPSIKVPHLLSLNIPIPDFELQKMFDGYLNKFIGKIEINYCQIQTLTQLRDTILPKLMSGDVRVKI